MINQPYEAYRLDEACWRIEENGVRAFLLAGTEKALLIDTGFGTGNIKEFAQQITDLPILLVNTHADRDHIGCNDLFDTAYMHPAEYDRYGQSGNGNLSVKPLWEGDRIDLGGRVLEVILIPGHTPGSIALLDAERRILFSGDSVQAGTIYMFGQGRNIKAYIESLRKLLKIRNRFDTVYPSHGPLPVRPEIMNDLITGAERIMSHEIEGTKVEGMDISAKVFDVGAAKFLYDSISTR